MNWREETLSKPFVQVNADGNMKLPDSVHPSGTNMNLKPMKCTHLASYDLDYRACGKFLFPNSPLFPVLGYFSVLEQV